MRRVIWVSFYRFCHGCNIGPMSSRMAYPLSKAGLSAKPRYQRSTFGGSPSAGLGPFSGLIEETLPQPGRRDPSPIGGGVTLGSLRHEIPCLAGVPEIRKYLTLRSFNGFQKRGNFLITRRSGVASDATRREAFAAEGCSRIPPPLPLKPSESKGSGGFVVEPQTKVGSLWGRFCDARYTPVFS